MPISCNCNTNNNASGKADAQNDKNIKPQTTNVIIDVQPFSDMPVEQTDYVFAELKKIYPSVKLLAAIEQSCHSWSLSIH